MIKVFRRIRQKLLLHNKTATYLLYAIGEIILVVIGILIALQFNNWNEGRKNQQELDNILVNIVNDLKTDTLSANAVIKLYDSIEANSKRIIAKEVTLENQEKFPLVRSLVSVYSPFNIQTKGFEKIKRFSNQNDIKNDSLVSSISQFYVALSGIIDDNNNFIKKEVTENIDAFKEKDWFVDWTQGKFTDEMKVYFLQSEDYRKRVASNLIFAVSNHKNVIVAYKQNAKKLIEKIEKNRNTDN